MQRSIQILQWFLEGREGQGDPEFSWLPATGLKNEKIGTGRRDGGIALLRAPVLYDKEATKKLLGNTS